MVLRKSLLQPRLVPGRWSIVFRSQLSLMASSPTRRRIRWIVARRDEDEMEL
jgi:hypothetical protein